MSVVSCVQIVWLIDDAYLSPSLSRHVFPTAAPDIPCCIVFPGHQGHLAGVSQSEWEAIPDVGDYSLKYKQSKRREIFTPMPDHVIEGARNDTAVSVFWHRLLSVFHAAHRPPKHTEREESERQRERQREVDWLSL